jgi:LmbE family N-acetylglucosaminyl deacetylase
VFTVTLLSVFLAARQHAVRHLPERILWIGAHPDDEAYVAPLLGRSCVEGNGTCSLLVLTRGEAGGDPDVRSQEMERAAALFRARLTAWTLSDIGIDVDGTWSAEAGGREELLRRIERVIAEEQPTVIYTFDPNHGSTCHPAHRAAGALVSEAVARLPHPPRLLLVETTVEFLPDDFVFGTATPDAIVVDASITWHYLVEDVEAHGSQFTREQIEALRNIAANQRRVYLSTAPAVPAEGTFCGYD